VCGHADAVELADAAGMRAEMEDLWAYHEQRLRPEIPTPRLMDRVAFSEYPPLRLVQCRDCGLVYRNPVERAHELREIYAGDPPTKETLRSLHDVQRDGLRVQARELRRVLGRGGSGLEVGSYVGAFLAAARQEGLQFEGLDVNAETNDFTRSMGFTVHDGELTCFQTDRAYDTVAIWNTFDQLADPRATVNTARRLLKAGGVLAIRVPNGGFYARARAAYASRGPARRRAVRAALAQNNLMTFPYRWGFTLDSLSRLLADHAFTVTQVRGDVLVPIGDEWTRPWARLEETLIKKALRRAARLSVDWAPWFEVYAIRD
jgi:SAM-dependent methyltransferase